MKILWEPGFQVPRHYPTLVHGMFKVWGVIILCFNTKAVKFYVAAGYSITVFMMSFEQFPSDHGRPAKVHSDR